jgi:hypothetical protein
VRWALDKAARRIRFLSAPRQQILFEGNLQSRSIVSHNWYRKAATTMVSAEGGENEAKTVDGVFPQLGYRSDGGAFRYAVGGM